ncbi:hypothetical protein Trydic_g8807 [Trypoxylus dichotomus]
MALSKIDSKDLLNTLNFQDWQKIITVKEDSESDGNFIICHALKHILEDDKKGVCLVTLKHDLAHYQEIGKHLDFNLVEKINSNKVTVIEPTPSNADDGGSSSKPAKKLKTDDKAEFAKEFFKKVRKNIREMKKRQSGYVYVVIDNIDCLLDLGIPLKGCLFLINMLLNFHERVNLIAGVNTSTNDGQSIATALCFISDMVITLNSLKNGSCLSGLMIIQRLDTPAEQYQFKAAEKGVKVFRPGECTSVTNGSNFKLVC